MQAYDLQFSSCKIMQVYASHMSCDPTIFEHHVVTQDYRPGTTVFELHVVHQD